MTIFLLSLGGFPPTAGFIAKWYIFSAAIGSGYYGLAIIGVLSSVVSVFFYLRIVVMMYMSERDARPVPRAAHRGRAWPGWRSRWSACSISASCRRACIDLAQASVGDDFLALLNSGRRVPARRRFSFTNPPNPAGCRAGLLACSGRQPDREPCRRHLSSRPRTSTPLQLASDRAGSNSASLHASSQQCRIRAKRQGWRTPNRGRDDP